MKISIIQPELAWENKTANLEHLSDLMLQLDHETDIIVLPEMFSTGFSMNTSLCEPYNGLTFNWMKRLASEGGFAVCGSYMVLEKEKVYNRFVFVTSDEDYSYDKRHLFSIGEEDRFFEKGNSRSIFRYKGWSISPFVCYDLRFPVWSRNRNDYDLAIYVSSWPEARINVWNTLLRARAIENQCYVAGSNRTGTDGNGVKHNGMSQIINPRGDLIMSAGANEEKVISADLSFEELKDFRKKFDVLRDADEFDIVF